MRRPSLPSPVVWLIVVSIAVVAVLAYATWAIPAALDVREPEIILSLVIVLLMAVLIVLLFIMTAGYSALNLADRRHALGLPDGSVRAFVALLLILIWVIVSIFLYRQVSGANGAVFNDESNRLAQQLFTTMSTLVVAISGFYFGANTVARDCLDVGTARSVKHS